MRFFDKLEKTVTETGKGIGRKAKELTEITRLKNMLHTCEEVIDQNYRTIGKDWFESHGEDEDNEYAEQCRAIRDAENGIAALKKQIANISAQSRQ